MTSKLLKFILFLFVAFVGSFAMSISTFTYARQVPGDQEFTGNFQPLETSGKRKPSAVPQLEVHREQGTVKDQLQLQLYAVRAQIDEAKQQFGSNHPEIRMLERRAKLLEAQVKAEAGKVAASRVKPSPEQLELKHKVDRAEKDALRAASLLLNADFKDEESKRSVRIKLQKLVQEAFDLRMQLQNSQLDDAEAKLATSRQRLIRRQSLAKQIVERRINELLDTDETKWSEQPLGVQKLASPQPKPKLDLVPVPLGPLGSTPESAARDEIKRLANACDFYRLNVGAFPAELQDLSQLPSGLSQAKWGGPYLEAPIVNDPWNQPYEYSPNDKTNTVSIQSAGLDGQFGSLDDVSNQQASRRSPRYPTFDTISTILERTITDSMKKIDGGRKMLAELTKDSARAETALEGGREACMELVWLLKAAGKIAPGTLGISDNALRIVSEKQKIEDLKLERDQLLLVLGSDAKVEALNLSINHREEFLELLNSKTFSGNPPEAIIQRYIVGVRQQINDLRLTLSSDLKAYRKNYAKAVKIDPAIVESALQSYKKEDLIDKLAGRGNKLIEQLDNSDAAQLAAQTFLDLYFSGYIEKATELTNNPRPLKMLREFVNPGTSAAPKVDGFSGGSFEANIFTDGVVQLKKALPSTGRKQATLSLRMQNNDSGWRVLQVFLGGPPTPAPEVVPSAPEAGPLLDKEP